MNPSGPTIGSVPDRPALVVGMGRSGTTMLFDCLGAHPDLGWPSQYVNRMPQVAAIAALSRTADLGNATRRWVNPSHAQNPLRGRFWPGPSEAVSLWRNWCSDRFVSDFLLGEVPSDDQIQEVRDRVQKLLRWQGKQRFSAKFTGPLRIQYLTALFPTARFLHLIRDPRAVINSLFKVEFWRNSYRFSAPAWTSGLTASDIERWEQSNRSPVALAALQWRAVVKLGRREAETFAPDRYAELQYEDLIGSPNETMRKALDFFELAPSARVDDALNHRNTAKDMNVKWRRELSGDEIGLIEELTGDLTSGLGYDSASQHTHRA